MTYEHTQYSRPWLPALVGVFLLSMLAIVASTGELVAILTVLGVAVVVGIAMLIFGRLTVRVSGDSLTATFGWGWPRKTVPLADVVSARAVRNRWWYGFGIRVIPGGTLWNVWGLEAVELQRASLKPVRIGTDEPDALLRAISSRVGAN